MSGNWPDDTAHRCLSTCLAPCIGVDPCCMRQQKTQLGNAASDPHPQRGLRRDAWFMFPSPATASISCLGGRNCRLSADFEAKAYKLQPRSCLSCSLHHSHFQMLSCLRLNLFEMPQNDHFVLQRNCFMVKSMHSWGERGGAHAAAFMRTLQIFLKIKQQGCGGMGRNVGSRIHPNPAAQRSKSLEEIQ